MKFKLFLICVTLAGICHCKVPNGWREDVCYPNSFDSIVSLYIKQAIRWKIPELKTQDLYEREFNKRKELFDGLLDYYCMDKVFKEYLVLGFDECFNIAFNVDPEVTDQCRKKIFLFPGDVKEADCSEDETKEGEEFRKCINELMKEKDPNFDLLDNAKTRKEKYDVELSKWFKKKSLKCMKRVFHEYLDDLQDEHEWPLWGNVFYYE